MEHGVMDLQVMESMLSTLWALVASPSISNVSKYYRFMREKSKLSECHEHV
jgi:uncharacterized membrane protein